MYRIPTFCPFCTANHYESLENLSLKLETEFASRTMDYYSERVISHSLHKWFSELMHFLPENLQHTQKKDEQHEIIRCKFYQKYLVEVI